MRAGTQTFGGHEIDISSVDKVMFPDSGITKGELLDHYDRVAEYALPYLEGRPVALKRCPDGIDDCFFQKSASDHFPEWIERFAVPLRGEDRDTVHVVVEDHPTLVYLADQGTIELHTWLSRTEDLECPDQAIFDFDPPGGDPDSADEARFAARKVRDLLDELSLPSLVKTSGSKGYHVHVLLDGSAPFEQVRAFTADVSKVLAGRYPERLTIAKRKDQREGRVFLDYLRNAYGQPAVAPYSVRALEGAPVATPLDWGELGDADPQRYTIGNLFRRLGQKDDPWVDVWGSGGALDEARARLDELMDEEG
ncbi:MAG: non-homologous end-joining DNA ligase [Nitriliruptorales bacterium]|nr:non-homologous end-joining DNA ligase [Nitriliruptorales bacterium]